MPEITLPEPSRVYRWMVLIVVSVAMFGNYYVYDALSPLADVLKQQLGFSDSNIGLLQAIYSFPNIFTVVIGGFIIDRIGLRKSLMIFGVLCFVGAAIGAAGGHLTVVQGKRTELRVRHQFDHRPPGFVRRPELSHLGALRVCQLASSLP